MTTARNQTRLRLVVVPVSIGVLAEWEQWMQAAGMSPRTITDRTQLVVRFEAAGIGSLDADWMTVAAFLACALFSAGTRSTYHGHLRAWFKWLLVMGHRADDPMLTLRPPRVPRRRPRPITVEQLGRLLSTRMHRRTRLMILLGAYQGLRVSEIAKTRGEYVRGASFRVIGKGRVDVDLPLHPLIAQAAATMPTTGLWFPSHVKLGPIKGNSVSAIIGDVMDRAGVPATAHALRHFFGTEVLRSSGGNLVVTQELMRHSCISSTAAYTQVDDEDRRAAVHALPVPLAA